MERTKANAQRLINGVLDLEHLFYHKVLKQKEEAQRERMNGFMKQIRQDLAICTEGREVPLPVCICGTVVPQGTAFCPRCGKDIFEEIPSV